MIYEERYTVVGIRDGRSFLDLCRQEAIPAARTAGGQVLCLVTGLIGDPGNAFLQMTAYEDLEAWLAAQGMLPQSRKRYVHSEQVRLLRQVAYLPRGVPSAEDRRAAYGYRRFFIDPASLDRFVECSEQGVWPRHHAAGSRILGLWTPLAQSFPMEVVLMTGYHGPGHWEETRFYGRKPDHIDDETWERGRSLGAERNNLLIGGSWVRLFRAHDVQAQARQEAPATPATGGEE